MMIDRYSFCHSTDNAAAVAAFEKAVQALAAHRPAVGLLTEAKTLAPEMSAAIALHGLAAVIMASADAISLSRDLAAASRAALRAAPGGGTTSERALVDAHALAAAGQLKAAALRLEHLSGLEAKNFLAIKLAHALRFMSGEPAAMLATTAAVLPHWSSLDPGYGYLLGCHAFGLEESGQFEAAERVGRQAAGYTTDDAWAIHAVAHVCEMQGRTRDGIGWLEPTAALWTRCGNFGGHLAWHLALFRLAMGQHTASLDVFDTYLHTASTCDFRDVANATSLLWRLEQEGVDVGDRWASVGRIAYQRRRDVAYVFGALHNLLALIGSRQLSAAHDVVAALSDLARDGQPDQSMVSAFVGRDLAETILAMSERRQARGPLVDIGAALGVMGGSVAQRDVFLRTLILIATESGDTISMVKLKSLRLRQRRMDGFLRLVEKRQSVNTGSETCSAREVA